MKYSDVATNDWMLACKTSQVQPINTKAQATWREQENTGKTSQGHANDTGNTECALTV